MPSEMIERGNVLPEEEIARWKSITETGDIPGTWYTGECRSKPDPEQLPIVFIPGLGNSASIWMQGTGNLYTLAYQQGYATAFVQLYDAAGRRFSESQWKNGALLARQLHAISEHFGSKVNVVGYSKGGIDAQVALIYHEAHPYVQNLITIATPHYGTPLADLAYSRYAGWLAQLLGHRSSGTYAIQTGVMESFRQQTDARAEIARNAYFTVAGTDRGGWGNYLWYGGLYLSSHGPNDGLVPLSSTQLPYGTHLFSDSQLHHDNMIFGTDTFNQIKLAFTSTIAQHKISSSEDLPSPSEKKPIIRERDIQGGELPPLLPIEKVIAVQSGKKEAIFQILTVSQITAVLHSPSGVTFTCRDKEYTAVKEEAPFAGAYSHAFQIPKPEAGIWKVQLLATVPDAFLLLAMFDGPEMATLQVKETTQEELSLAITIDDPDRWNLASLEVDLTADPVFEEVTSGEMFIQHYPTVSLQKQSDTVYEGSIKTDGKVTVYNVTVVIKGKQQNGEDFKRVLIQSIYK